jgi:hypothetical protein
LGPLFPQLSLCINIAKKYWATFWAKHFTNSSGHLEGGGEKISDFCRLAENPVQQTFSKQTRGLDIFQAKTHLEIVSLSRACFDISSESGRATNETGKNVKKIGGNKLCENNIFVRSTIVKTRPSMERSVMYCVLLCLVIVDAWAQDSVTPEVK